jgi:hypothetical protein
MTDDELARMPYADLWLSELGDVVPEHRAGEAVLPIRHARDPGWIPTPHPTRSRSRA